MPETRPFILVVEDEPDLAELVVLNLRRQGFEAEAEGDGARAWERIRMNPPDLVVLDLMLPGLSGSAVATRMKENAQLKSLPILMLTALASDADQVAGLGVGADDYVTKPFSMPVLIARVKALLRRAGGGGESGRVNRLGPIRIEHDVHTVRVEDSVIDLTLMEFKLLSAMVEAGGKVLSRRDLISIAMGPDVTVTERTIDVHVTAIRRKLGEAGALIRTVRGVGYRMSEAD